jgi:hypothetical protein
MKCDFLTLSSWRRCLLRVRRFDATIVIYISRSPLRQCYASLRQFVYVDSLLTNPLVVLFYYLHSIALKWLFLGLLLNKHYQSERLLAQKFAATRPTNLCSRQSLNSWLVYKSSKLLLCITKPVSYLPVSLVTMISKPRAAARVPARFVRSYNKQSQP